MVESVLNEKINIEKGKTVGWRTVDGGGGDVWSIFEGVKEG